MGLLDPLYMTVQTLPRMAGERSSDPTAERGAACNATSLGAERRAFPGLSGTEIVRPHGHSWNGGYRSVIVACGAPPSVPSRGAAAEELRTRRGPAPFGDMVKGSVGVLATEHAPGAEMHH
jgi:hypothetical protein